MIERVVENWLTNVNERSMEVPFCQLLNAEGHQVVHLSRHGPYEEGKDILSIAPDNQACAYQLKSGNITLKVWASELDQIIRLVEVPLTHASIPEDAFPQHHRPYLVTNGKIDEEVRIEIEHRNRDWERRGYPKLEVIVGGQLLQRFIKISTNLWPTELKPVMTLLEFFLADGTDNLDKFKFANFIQSLLPIFKDDVKPNECSRALDSAAVVTSYAISRYVEKENHVAIIEAWTIYITTLILLVEKHKLPRKYWQNTLNLIETVVKLSFNNLCKELYALEYLVEGNTLVDQPFYHGRVTWLLGLVCTLAK